MGATQSKQTKRVDNGKEKKHTSADSTTPLNASNFVPDETELEGHSNVTRPPPPPRLLRLSELIDPAKLGVDGHVRSPSGNVLAPEQFLVHPDRPRSIRERQERIREQVRAASRLGVEVEVEEETKKVGSLCPMRVCRCADIVQKRSCCSCFR